MEKDDNSRKDGKVFLFTYFPFKDKQTKEHSMLSYFCTLFIVYNQKNWKSPFLLF